MVRGVGIAVTNVWDKTNHKVRLVHHRTYRFRAWSPGAPIHRKRWTRRSAASICRRGRSLAIGIVGTWPRMVWRSERWIVRADAEWTRLCHHRMMPHTAQDPVCLGLVVIDALPIAPTVRGKVESHGEVLLTIGRRHGRPRRTIRAHRPRKVA